MLNIKRSGESFVIFIIPRSRSTTAYNETYFVYQILGLRPIWSSDLEQSNEYFIKQPSDI